MKFWPIPFIRMSNNKKIQDFPPCLLGCIQIDSCSKQKVSSFIDKLLAFFLIQVFKHKSFFGVKIQDANRLEIRKFMTWSQSRLGPGANCSNRSVLTHFAPHFVDYPMDLCLQNVIFFPYFIWGNSAYLLTIILVDQECEIYLNMCFPFN